MNFFKSKLRSLIIVLMFFGATINADAQDETTFSFTGKFKNVLIVDIFNQIEKAGGVTFYYKPEWFDKNTTSAEFSGSTMEDVLHYLFDNTPYQYEVIQGNQVVILPRDKVALIKKAGNDYNDIYKSQVFEIGNPIEKGKYSVVKLEGRVLDGKTSEPLTGATVWIENTNQAVSTDAEGRYKFNITPGNYTLQYQYLGFEKSTYNLSVISNGSFDAELFQESKKLDEVVVYARDAERNVKSTQMSKVELNSRAIKQLPSLIGEKDIIKSFTMMPGVQSVGEFGSGFNVRGGGEDQNLYLLEGTPVFNTSHVFGMLSVVNPDIVKEVSLYKGHIPAEYGERVSSVMDIKMYENGISKPKVKGGIGIYNSRLMIQLPIIKEHISLKVAGRSSYSDWLLKKIPDYNLQNSSTSFYDISASLNADYKKNKVQAFGYKSFDKFMFVDSSTYNYGNELASLTWRSILSPNFFSKFLVSYSNYKVERDKYGSGQNAATTTSEVNYLSGKLHFNYTGLSLNNFETGVQAIKYKILPGDRIPLGTESDVKPESISSEQSFEYAVYLNDKIDPTSWLSLSLGLRFASYSYLGEKKVYYYYSDQPRNLTSISDSNLFDAGEKIQSYSSIEPRLSAKVLTSDNSSVKLSYNRNNQFISLLSFTSVSSPEDIWKLSDNNLKPVICDQLAFGYYNNFRANTIEASVEVYYKILKNLPEFKNDASADMNHHIETELFGTEGKNYGLEIMVKKNSGNLEGWISYTYSRALRKTSGLYPEEIINNNDWYRSSYDKPNNLSVVSTYHINRRWRLTGTFNYSTGRAVTLPEYQFEAGGQTVTVYSTRNKYRLPDYHRLDLALSVDESLRRSKKFKGSWTFSIINVYARKNAFSVFYKKEDPSAENNYKMYSLYKLYIIGIPLPTVTYNFIF